MYGLFDGHSDLLSDVVFRHRQGERHVLNRHYLEKLQRGDVEGLVLAIWTDPNGDKSYGEQTRECLLYAREAFREAPWMSVVCRAEEANIAKKQGNRYAFLSVEGMAAIGEEITGVDAYADYGVRMAMLTWNEENQLATGAKGDPYSGLTAFGKAVVRRMQQRGMIVDVSHLNDGGFWEVLHMAQGAVIASHSNCRALCDVQRNLTDAQLRGIRDTGGVVGVNAYHGFVHLEKRYQTVEMLARHAAHMVDVMGVDHVACGLDFCEFLGPGNDAAAGIEDWEQAHSLFSCLKEMGMHDAELEKIARGNLLRVLE